jgi:hypothetical protein
MKRQFNLAVLLGILMLTLLVGCKQLDSFSKEGGAPADAITGNTGVSLAFSFTSMLDALSNTGNSEPGDLVANGSTELFDAGTATYFTGTVAFESVPAGVVNSYAISAAVDGSFEAKLEQTVALQGGQYNVSVAFSDATQEYYGAASNVTMTEDATNDIDITISPVIGDTMMTGDITGSVSLYDFQYTATDFDTASDTYEMLVYLDGGAAVTFTFDDFTENALLYINISDGTHDVKLEIVKHGTPDVVIARYQGVPNFTAGSGQTLNLTPIFGTSTFTLAESGGDAVFNLKILQGTYNIVNSETGGSFQYRFSATGTQNNITEEVLSLAQDGDNNWAVSRTYAGFQYESMNAEIKIRDTGADRQIGSCSFTVSLTKNQAPVSCDLTLERRATISGEVLQVLGVNVVDETGDTAPANTSVYVNGVFRAFTGGAGVTNGYANIFLEPSVTPYSIHAVDTGAATSSAVTSYTAESWKVDNILLRLDQ